MKLKEKWQAITSIEKKIRILTITVLLFSILLCTATNTIISYRINNHNIKQYNSALLNQISNSIDSYFSTMDQLIFGFTCNTASQGYLNACYKAESIPPAINTNYLKTLLQLLSNSLPDCSFHLFVENNNFVPIHVGSTVQTIASSYNYKSDKWYQDFLLLPENQMSYLLPSLDQHYYPDPDSGGICAVYRIRNIQNLETIGYLLVDIPGYVIKHLVKTDSGTNFYIRIELPRDFTLYDSVPHSPGRKYIELTLEEPKTGWMLTAYTQNDYYYYNFIFIILSNIVSAIAIGSIVTLFSIHFAGSLTEPLRLLTISMEEMEMGNFGNSINYDTNDEMGYLIEKYNIMNQKIEELTQKNESAQLAERNAHIAALQNQINPHFLYNTLEMIKGIADGPSSPIIKNCCNALSRMFRYNLKGPYWVTLSQELEHIRYYLYIMRHRFDDLFTVEYTIDETLLQYKCIKFFLQPFIENAIIHGFTDYQIHGILSICITRADAGLICVRITDNGHGMDLLTLTLLQDKLSTRDPGELPEEGNIGISNTHRRFLYNYGEQYQISVKSELNKGTDVVIIIPKSL